MISYKGHSLGIYFKCFFYIYFLNTRVFVKQRLYCFMQKNYSGSKHEIVRVGFTHVPDDNIPSSLYEDPIKWGNSFTQCPATVKVEDHTYSIISPMELNMIQQRDDEGMIRTIDTPKQEIKHTNLFEEQFISVDNNKFWKHDNIPSFQIHTPFAFFCDEDIEMFTLPAFYNQPSAKGASYIAGTYNIHRWLRPLQVAFKFDSPTSEFHIKRGTVLTNLMFSKPVELEFVPWNDKLQTLMESTDNITSYVKNSWGFFKNFKIPESYFD